MLALVQLAFLAAADAPLEEQPLLEPTVALAPAVDDRWHPSRDIFPRPSLLQFLENLALTATRPVRPQTTDVFVIVPALAGTAIALNTDLDSYRAIKKLPDPKLLDHPLSEWVSYLGEGWVDVAIFIGVAVLGGRDGQRAGMAGIQALMAVAVVSRGLKMIFRVERPSYDREQQHFYTNRVIAADAMPSGHVMSAFATAAVLSKEYPKVSPLFYALATWVALARVQQDTHWVSDTVLGAALGLLIGWEAWDVTRRFELDVQPWATSSGGGVQVARTF